MTDNSLVDQSAYLQCIQRGPVVTTIAARVAGCGCSRTTPINVYECKTFCEPVLLRGAPPCMDTMREKAPGYTGRTCRECEVPRLVVKAETLPRMPPPPETIAVVVTCHNYGRYLRQCLDSILTQTERPAAIVLVDDSSSDDTPAIAAEYARGVRYLRGEWRDVALARNAGAALCGEPAYYSFIDADDYLAPTYLSELHAAMTDPRIGVTYPQCDRFTEEKRLGPSPWITAFDPIKFQRRNCACCSSLVRRQACDQVGGWRSYRYGLHDWDLWLRIIRAGWTMRYAERAILHYRIHPGSMSDDRHGNYECGAEVMSRSQLTAVVTLFSGRDWMLDRWFAQLSKVEWTRENLHLVAVDNSRSPAFAAALRQKLDSCGLQYTYVRDDRRITESASAADVGASAPLRTANTYAMGVHLARLYSLATQYLPAAAANVWSVEDDVGIQPNFLQLLATELFRREAAAVSGCLRSRFGNRTIAWAGGKSVAVPPGEPIKVDATGFFCLLARRDAWDAIAWRPGNTGTHQYPYYDWAACADITRACGPIYLLGSVRCRHWQADGTCLEV